MTLVFTIPPANRGALYGLTEREIEVFLHSATGDAEAAKKLGISRRTLGFHRRNLCGKLGLRDKFQLAALLGALGVSAAFAACTK